MAFNMNNEVIGLVELAAQLFKTWRVRGHIQVTWVVYI